MSTPSNWRPPPPIIFKFDPKKPKPDAFAAWTVIQIHQAYQQGYSDAKKEIE